MVPTGEGQYWAVPPGDDPEEIWWYRQVPAGICRLESLHDYGNSEYYNVTLKLMCDTKYYKTVKILVTCIHAIASR